MRSVWGSLTCLALKVGPGKGEAAIIKCAQKPGLFRFDSLLVLGRRENSVIASQKARNLGVARTEYGHKQG